MGFQLESEMLEPVSQWLKSKGYVLKSEVPTPFGICDVVAVKFQPKRVALRNAYGQTRRLFSIKHVAIVHHLPDVTDESSMTLKKLRRILEFNYGLECTEQDLQTLDTWGFIFSPRRGCYQKINGWFPLQESFVTIELKLERVTDVISQAKNNTYFAPESYVALPTEVAARVCVSTRADEIRSEGIGLLSVGEKKCEVLIPAVFSRKVRGEVIQKHLVERFWLYK